MNQELTKMLEDGAASMVTLAMMDGRDRVRIKGEVQLADGTTPEFVAEVSVKIIEGEKYLRQAAQETREGK